MPLEGLRTFTNMGGGKGVVEGDDWKTYEHEVTPADPTMIEMGTTEPAGRVPPAEIKQQKKGRKPVPKSKREVAVEEAIEKDLKKRNIRKPKTKKEE